MFNQRHDRPKKAGRSGLWRYLEGKRMGMHIGLIAAKTSTNQFCREFSKFWPNYEVITATENLPDLDSLWSWKKANEQFVSAANWTKDNPGKEVYVFWQDGPWAVMLDESYVLASDEEALKKASQQFEIVVSFVVETAGGCASFLCFENGALRRKICNNDADVEVEGNPLEEEAGIDIESYYMDETESLMRAFGLSPFDTMPLSNGLQAVCVADRTDYEYLKNKTTQPKEPEMNAGQSPTGFIPITAKKPWWKFW